MDIEANSMAVVDEIERSRKRNKILKEKMSKYQEETNQIIIDLRNQLQKAKKSEEDLVVFLRKRIQYFEKIKKEITQVREGVDEKTIKSKFQNSSRILDGILSSQRPSGDRPGLGFVKEKKLESFPVTNQEGSKKHYVEVLNTSAKKERSKKDDLISKDKNRNNLAPKRPNRYLQIFLGHYFSCNNFGYKALN